MRSSFLSIVLLTCFTLLSVHQGVDLIKDTLTLDQVRIGINQVYNCDFDEAENTLVYLRESYPSHPITPFFEELIYYWKFYPLIPGNPGALEFEEVMEETWQLFNVKYS